MGKEVKKVKTWRILFENGWEIHYKGDYCGAVNCADGYSIARGCGYTIEEWKEQEEEK